MAKGNLLLGTARKKLGDIVFYRTGGEQRTRTRVTPMNPRSNAQILQRIVVATTVKAYQGLVSVSDHAFQGYSGKAKNMERYMRLNIKKFREMALENIKSFSPLAFNIRNVGNWSLKDATDYLVNEYIISEGDLPEVQSSWGKISDSSAIDYPKIEVGLKVDGNNYMPISAMTYENFAEALGIQVGDQLTFVFFITDGETGIVKRAEKARIIIMPSDGDTSKNFLGAGSTGGYIELNDPNQENYGQISMLAQSSETSPSTLTVFPSFIRTEGEAIGAYGIITSRYENKQWRRSTTTMKVYSKEANKRVLPLAMYSYLEEQSSSLYLNQASSTTKADATNARTLKAEETVEIEEKKSSNRKK